MENSNTTSVPSDVQPTTPAVAQSLPIKKAGTNVLVEVMEGVTLSALLILFSFMYYIGATYLLMR
jgi:hypothetical protein